MRTCRRLAVVGFVLVWAYVLACALIVRACRHQGGPGEWIAPASDAEPPLPYPGGVF
jgi:hypothetical protein